jgi:hypothetical protein
MGTNKIIKLIRRNIMSLGGVSGVNRALNTQGVGATEKNDSKKDHISNTNLKELLTELNSNSSGLSTKASDILKNFMDTSIPLGTHKLPLHTAEQGELVADISTALSKSEKSDVKGLPRSEVKRSCENRLSSSWLTSRAGTFTAMITNPVGLLPIRTLRKAFKGADHALRETISKDILRGDNNPLAKLIEGAVLYPLQEAFQSGAFALGIVEKPSHALGKPSDFMKAVVKIEAAMAQVETM